MRFVFVNHEKQTYFVTNKQRECQI